jgi:hypothetical protein
MLSEFVAILILASPNQVRGDARPRLEPPRLRGPAIHVMTQGEPRALTLEIPSQAASDEENDDQVPAQPVMRFNLNTAVLERDNFDRWLFPNDLSDWAREKHLTNLLDTKIDLITSAHKLNDSQRAKLRLAGRGDIKRFFDEVQQRRDEFEIERKNFKTGLASLHRLDEVSSRYRIGPFGDESLLAKTLHKINNDRKGGN